jgi:25S rRNA (uracil2634-N3)-methyltransferase
MSMIFFRDVPRLAKKPPPPTSASMKPNPIYALRRSFVFDRRIWSGYEHRMTKGERAHGHGKTGEGGEDRTWEFYLADLDM